MPPRRHTAGLQNTPDAGEAGNAVSMEERQLTNLQANEPQRRPFA
jgi:hypothetical protein